MNVLSFRLLIEYGFEFLPPLLLPVSSTSQYINRLIWRGNKRRKKGLLLLRGMGVELQLFERASVLEVDGRLEAKKEADDFGMKGNEVRVIIFQLNTGSFARLVFTCFLFLFFSRVCKFWILFKDDDHGATI